MSNFTCIECRKVVNSEAVGTRHRNHCPYCLWSRHVDVKPGDRVEPCQGMMEPTGLTFKGEGFDKYGKKRQGEIMIIHRCERCGKESKNRIAGDDNPEAILAICEKKDREEVKKQLFGKNF